MLMFPDPLLKIMTPEQKAFHATRLILDRAKTFEGTEFGDSEAFRGIDFLPDLARYVIEQEKLLSEQERMHGDLLQEVGRVKDELRLAKFAKCGAVRWRDAQIASLQEQVADTARRRAMIGRRLDEYFEMVADFRDSSLWQRIKTAFKNDL